MPERHKSACTFLSVFIVCMMKLCYPKCAQWRFWANCIYKISTTYILTRNNYKKKYQYFFVKEMTGYSGLELIHMCTSAVSRCQICCEYSHRHYKEWSGKISNSVRKHNFGHVPSLKIQISLHIHAVWSESSLDTFWIAKDAKFLHGNNGDW